MKNKLLHPLEGTGYSEADKKVEMVRKEWNKPTILEISRFSILGGGTDNKVEAGLLRLFQLSE